MPFELGTLAVDVNQHRAYPEGACLTLSVDWLAHNLGADENLPQTEADVKRLQLTGQMHYDLLDLKPEHQANFLFREFGLVIEETQAGRDFVPDSLVDKALEIGGALLIAFWRQIPNRNEVSTGHAVSAKIGTVMVEFYDSNLGYFSMHKGAFKNAFCEHLELNYPNHRGRWVVQRISGPRPGI